MWQLLRPLWKPRPVFPVSRKDGECRVNSGVRWARYSLLVLGLSLLAVSLGAAAEDAGKILGSWRGTSVCVNREAAAACRDEEVLYEFREMTPPVAGKLTVKADKVVEGKVVPMGELDVVRDPGSETWTCDFQTPRFHGLWSYTQHGEDELTGTLISLPDRTLLRKVTARRAPKS